MTSMAALTTMSTKNYPCAGDAEAKYGVRVPALVVTPYALQELSGATRELTIAAVCLVRLR